MRFLDDIFGIWSGSHGDFLLFFDDLNIFLSRYGLEFEKKKMQIGKKVDFLDVSVDISSGSLETDIYIKPTDSPSLLHRSSFAPPHLFKSIPYSQFRRATIICSNDQNL